MISGKLNAQYYSSRKKLHIYNILEVTVIRIYKTVVEPSNIL